MTVRVELIELVAEAGMPIALFDQDMRQCSEWVDLVLDDDGTLLGRFADPAQSTTVTHYVVWDKPGNLMQPREVDLPVRIRPGNVPVEIRISPNREVSRWPSA